MLKLLVSDKHCSTNYSLNPCNNYQLICGKFLSEPWLTMETASNSSKDIPSRMMVTKSLAPGALLQPELHSALSTHLPGNTHLPHGLDTESLGHSGLLIHLLLCHTHQCWLPWSGGQVWHLPSLPLPTWHLPRLPPSSLAPLSGLMTSSGLLWAVLFGG